MRPPRLTVNSFGRYTLYWLSMTPPLRPSTTTLGIRLSCAPKDRKMEISKTIVGVTVSEADDCIVLDISELWFAIICPLVHCPRMLPRFWILTFVVYAYEGWNEVDGERSMASLRCQSWIPRDFNYAELLRHYDFERTHIYLNHPLCDSILLRPILHII